MEELAQVYARSLFEVAREQGKLDELREQLGQFADALDAEPRARRVLLLALLLDHREAGRRSQRCSTAPTRRFMNFLELLIENHRMPVIFRIRQRVRAAVGGGEPARCRSRSRARSSSTRRPPRASAGRSASAPGARSTLAAHVDPDILGGIVVRVGNSILDASIRNRLEQLRRHVAQGAS